MSNLIELRKWQNIPQEKIDALDEFMMWLEFDYGDLPKGKAGDNLVKYMQMLVDKFLGESEALKQVEQQLLDKWIERNAN